MNSTIPWLNLKTPLRIAVIGDVILDEYLDGPVTRISPEAPVPVHLVTQTIHGAGGAANAARNVRLAGGDVWLLSVWGDDEAARHLRQILDNDGVNCSLVEVVDDRPTIRKTRITSSSYQLVRVDWERVHPIVRDVQERLFASLKELEFDAILISDYGKGALPEQLIADALDLAEKRGIPAVIDPKGRDFSKYARASLITPNRKEACEALGLDPSDEWSGVDLGRRLQEKFRLRNVLVTLGPKGMALVTDGAGGTSEAIELPAVAREVYDVSGAGDTVAALMVLAMGCGAPLRQGMHIANTAAAIVVEKWGTQPIYLHELQRTLYAEQQGARLKQGSIAKVVTREALAQALMTPHERVQKVVFTNGCFDILHAGHIAYLEKARALGDLLVVGVNSDESVARLKGKSRPYVALKHRMRLLAALSCVDYVCAFSEDTPLDLISTIVPDVLVKGADWKKEDIVGADVVEAAGGQVDTIEFVPGLSTTEIVRKIKRSAEESTTLP